MGEARRSRTACPRASVKALRDASNASSCEMSIIDGHHSLLSLSRHSYGPLAMMAVLL